MQTKSLQMKRALRTALLVLLMSAAGTEKGYAHDFVVNGIYYSIISSNDRTVEVTNRNGDYNSYSGNIEIPSTIPYNGYTYTITRIGNKAFFSFNNAGVTHVTLPNSILEIGDEAFYGCRGITSISIPNSVTAIGGGAFTDCHGLTSITIPESIESIGRLAFQFCTNLTTVNFNATNCTNVSVYTDNNGIFHSCTSFTTLNIGENVKRIPSKTFINCTALRTLTIPQNTESISGAFEGCIGLDTVIFEAVDCIARAAFKGCSNLTTLNYVDGVKHIYASIGDGCNSLRNISIPNSVISIASNYDTPFQGSGWYNDQPDGLLYLDGWCLGYKMGGWFPTGKLTFQTGTKGICEGAFSGCYLLDTVVFPNTMMYIGNGTFSWCSNLKDIIIPNVVLIGQNAFGNCEKIVSVSLGNSINSIGSHAFSNCPNLNTLLLLNPTPPILGDDVFQGISSIANLFVPCGSQLAYFTNWNIFDYNNIHEDCTPRPVSVSSNITGGTVTPSVSQATMGQEVRLTVTPNPGMTLSSLTVYNTVDPTQIIPITPIGKTTSVYSFVMPPYAVSVSASFEHGTTYSISINPNISGGSIAASTSSATAGEIVTLNVRPNSGYELQTLTVYNANNASQIVTVTNNTFIMPSFDVMVSASFNYTSVDENDCVSASIHPNPTSSIITIEAENLKQIYICNMLGQVIYESEAFDNELEYDFSKYGEGIYLIRIETSNGVVTKRVVVTR